MALERPFVLTGFMGAGKTTIAEGVAAEYGVPHYDTDAHIMFTSGMTIPEIFASQGENHFRQLEAEALRTILDREPGIISTGGGIVASESGRLALHEADATIVWLRVDISTAFRRAGNDPNRPLARDFKTFRQRFDERQPFYRQTAHFVIDTATTPLDKAIKWFGPHVR